MVSLVDGQVHDVLGADGYRDLPVGGGWFAAADHDDVGAPRQRGAATAACPCRVEKYRAGPGPGLPARRVRNMDDGHTGGGGDAVDLVAHRRLGEHREDAVSCVHQSTVQAGSDAMPAPRRRLWTGPQLWMK